MNDRETLYIDDFGELIIGGCKAQDLAKYFGTPLYVFDEQYIRLMMQTYKLALDKYYDGYGMPLYASKAFSCLAMYKIAMQEGLGVDVVSGGELNTAYIAGFPMENVFMHGNSKTNDELELAVELGVGVIVIDCMEEAKILDRLAAKKNTNQKVLIRVNPGVEAHTHQYIQTAKTDSKFGFSAVDGSAIDFTRKVLSCKNLTLLGYHCHIGSQIFEKTSFAMAIDKMTNFMVEVKDKTGFEPSLLNMGGGFGIWYTDEDPKLKREDYDEFVKVICDCLKSQCQRFDLKLPYLVFEPGRSIVGEAGITLYTVNTVKDIPGVKRYVAVDGGMGDNPRFALYQSKYTVLHATKAKDEPVQCVSIAGKCCESGDIIAENIPLPEVKRGDLLAVLSTGAYNYSMASNYNRNIIPGAVLVSDGYAETIIRRQALNDLLRYDVVPDRLK